MMNSIKYKMIYWKELSRSLVYVYMLVEMEFIF